MSDKQIELGKVQGVTVTAERSVVWTSLIMWLGLTLLGHRVWRLKPGAAVAGGLIATGLHFLSEVWHQLGHAHAAQRTGHPMTGIHLWAALGTSIYPENEPPLPAEVHIERALGGPRASILMALMAGTLAVLAWPLRSVTGMVTTIFALDNLLVFTLGAFLPLPMLETDGMVLLKYGRRRRRNIVIQE